MALPVIGPGCGNIFDTNKLNVLAVPEPQALFAMTEILPPVAPTVTVIETEVEVPVHPEGRAHVYEVAPVTAEML
jgi:hypothetical protein